MSRPTTYDDLPDYARQGHLVATIAAEFVVKYPSLGQHLLSALAEAERLGMTVQGGEIRLERTTEELDEALANHQRIWDNAEERYRKAFADPSTVEGVWQGIVNRHAADEGYPAIDFEAIEVTA